jgi:hypothetical protein
MGAGPLFAGRAIAAAPRGMADRRKGIAGPHSLSAALNIALGALPTYAFRSWTSVFRSPASIQSKGPRTAGTTGTNPPTVRHVFRWQHHGSHRPA